ncbi:DUF2345 domain-containing protein [Acinetobacter colistiniresistens]|uniref:DUF2345 domain-containing protein n=1 Tax=Acinetobacter colistiniresistens TaxID=280145 RepID=UPI00211C1243|nr:DUF2345 domain-containing protein [Acinetobacter colistiniresistens]UUM26925.1 DUF2345 domain-containing protein [Acinetobacter colistiniresistens]
MAGGSRILINDQGITISTGGQILYQAGQHKFDGGKKVKAEIPSLPLINPTNVFTNKWDFYDLFYEIDFSNVKYKLINNKNHTYVSGGLDEHGRTQRITTSKNEHYDLLIGTDDEWTVSIDDESDDIDFQYDCSCGSHKDHEDEI